MNEIASDPNLAETYHVISRAERELKELEVPSTETLMRRLVERLDSLRHSGHTLDAKLLYELTRRRLGAFATEEQLDRLGKAVRTMFDWPDVYISYTNRDARFVNEQNKPWIRSLISERDFAARLSTENLAALVVRDHLKRNGVAMFSQDQSLASLKDINDAVRARVTYSMTLIQLIEQASFNVDGENWMFNEYHWFMSRHELGDPRAYLRYLPILLDAKLEDIT